MKRFRGVKGTIVLLILAFTLVGYYFYLSNRQQSLDSDEVETTAVQELLLRDLSRDYPGSPKEVLRYYSEITKCFYNEEYSDEELKELTQKAVELYDQELTDFQIDYPQQLQKEIESYKTQGIEISSYKISNSTDVNYYTKDGKECASLFCTYTLRQGTSLQSVEEVFILRRDDAGHWKIFGWDVAKPEIKQTIESSG